jgi:hypothetical protein
MLAAFGVALLLAVVIVNDAYHLIGLICVAGGLTLAWMLLPKPIYGIKVSSTHLTLAAWRKPRQVLLNDIDHLRATDVSEETQIAIVYKNGEEEGIFAADLPDVDTLVSVMAERGIPVRGVY